MKSRMKKSLTRLLALAATTAVTAFGATGAGATLLGDTIYACGGANLAGTVLQQATTACGTTNVFNPSSATVSSNVEFTQLLGKLGWTVTADVGGASGSSDSLVLTFSNSGASKALPTTTGNVAALFLGGLNFADGVHITGISLSGNANGLVDTAGSQFGYYDGTTGPAALQPLAGDYIYVDLNSAAFGTVAQGGTYSLTATITTGVPEPGSLALLGVVLIALALVYVGRVRLFGFRSMGQKLAS